jgi:hypothetical protein
MALKRRTCNNWNNLVLTNVIVEFHSNFLLSLLAYHGLEIMKKRANIVVVLICLMAPMTVLGQISFGIYGGVGTSLQTQDAYALSKTWPTTGSTGDKQLAFYEGSSTSAIMANVGWDITRHFGIAFVYRSTNFPLNDNHRSGTSTSMGFQMKINFASNTRKVIPFFQAAYMFSNNHNLKQDKVTSPTIPTQTLPAMDISYSTSLGLAADFGIEFKLGQAFALVVMAGAHGADMNSSDATKKVQALNWGTGVIVPQNIDGTLWAQGSLGLKYYVQKGKKKRDF